MRREGIIIILVLILILLSLGFVIFKYVYFSLTTIEVIDSNGNPIINAQVRIEYRCIMAVPDVGGGTHSKDFGYRESLTNSQGKAKFNSLNKGFVFNLPFPVIDCQKNIRFNKEGYCEPNNPYIEAPENQDPCWIKFGGGFSKIGALKKEVQLTLQKSNDYEKYLLEEEHVSCELFREKCLEYDEFNTALSTNDESICNKKFISNYEKQNLIFSCNQGAFRTIQEPGEISLTECLERYKSSEEYNFIWKDLNYECYTEIAFTKKDPSICNNVIDSEMQERCFEFLAIELEDPLICKKGNNEAAFEYCKFDAIKKSGDSSKCSLINAKDIQEFCEVYFS